MRRVLGVLAAALLAGVVQAQTEVVVKSRAQSLACLVKPAKAPQYPDRDKRLGNAGAMRVLLKFSKPDAAPAVELLFSSALQEMQEEVQRYLAGYRLPCLTAEDGTVTAVQEFSFSNVDRDPTSLDRPRREGEPPFCLVVPPNDMGDLWSAMDRMEVEHVVAAATFAGNGQQPPEVEFLYSTRSKRFEDMVRAQLAKYRMPCRTGSEKPQGFQQQFSVIPERRQLARFKREPFALLEFLRMTREPEKLKASFDFKTMGCPFKVTYHVYGGAVPNEAYVAGPVDPNKLPFLRWLAGLQVAFKNDMQANELFGSELQIDIPCGALVLSDEG
jgi:hypothetical protein